MAANSNDPALLPLHQKRHHQPVSHWHCRQWCRWQHQQQQYSIQFLYPNNPGNQSHIQILCNPHPKMSMLNLTISTFCQLYLCVCVYVQVCVIVVFACFNHIWLKKFHWLNSKTSRFNNTHDLYMDFATKHLT